MADKRQMWFVYVAGDVTEAARNAVFRAEYDADANETTVIVYAHLAEGAREIAGRFGTVLDWTQITEAKKV